LKHGGLVFCCFGGRKSESSVAALSSNIIGHLRAGGYQHKTDFVVSIERTELSVFVLQLLLGSGDQQRQSIDQIV
jgi:hypothetical protein